MLITGPHLSADELILYVQLWQVHIAGVGDFASTGITSLADPCPLPSAAKKKGLRDKEKLFYAPMSGLGDLLYDKDAVYININDHLVQFSKVDEDTSASGKGRYAIYVELYKISTFMAVLDYFDCYIFHMGMYF